MLFTVDSVEQFTKECPDDKRDGDWFDGLDFKQTMIKARSGDSKYVAKAEKHIENLECILPETINYEMIRSPFGSRVNMGDWTANSPTPMRRRIKRITDVAPIKIVVDLTCSGGLDADVIEARGAAILALLLKVQQIRPVELYTFIGLDGRTDGASYVMIRQESKPLNIAQVAFCLCHVAFVRHGYEYLKTKDGAIGMWPDGHGTSTYHEKLRTRFNLDPKDILIKEAHYNDPIVRQPEQWIKNELAKITNNMDGDE